MSAFGSPPKATVDDDDEYNANRGDHEHDDDDDGGGDDERDNYVLTTAGARRTQQAELSEELDNAPSWREVLTNRDTLTRLTHVALFVGIVWGLVKAAPSLKFTE
jgi:hypothetical protein